MAELIKSFPPVAPSAIASYNGIDIATGGGTATYYLMRDLNSVEFLSTTAGYSTDGKQRNIAAIDLDFDVEILTPTTYEGDAIVSISIQDYSGATAASPTLTATIRKWDGTTETDIATANGSTAVPVGESEVWTLKIAVPKTNFKIGDTLRLTIAVTIRVNANYENRIWFDPSGLYVSSPNIRSTISKLVMPVRIDL